MTWAIDSGVSCTCNQKQPRRYNISKSRSSHPGLGCPYPAARPHTRTLLSISGTCPSPLDKKLQTALPVEGGMTTSQPRVHGLQLILSPLFISQLSPRQATTFLGFCFLVCKVRVIFYIALFAHRISDWNLDERGQAKAFCVFKVLSKCQLALLLKLSLDGEARWKTI